MIDFERGNCKWKLANGRRYHWPMTRADCALGYSAVEDRENATGKDLTALTDAIAVLKDTTNSTRLMLFFMLSASSPVEMSRHLLLFKDVISRRNTNLSLVLILVKAADYLFI